MSHFLFSVSTSGRLGRRFASTGLEPEGELALLLIPSPDASPGYLAVDWWVESRCLSNILPHRFSVRDERHRIGRSTYWEAASKTSPFFLFCFLKNTKPTVFIYCLSNIIKIPKQVLAGFLPPAQSAASPSQVTPSKVPSHALHSKPLKDLFDIERGRIISPSLKKRERARERDAAI